MPEVVRYIGIRPTKDKRECPTHRIIAGDKIPEGGRFGFFLKPWVVGTIGFQDFFELTSEEDGQRCMQLSEIEVEAQYLRQGYATLLIQKAEEIAKEHGLFKVFTAIHITNPPMLNLIEKLGYTEVVPNEPSRNLPWRKQLELVERSGHGSLPNCVFEKRLLN